MDWIIIEFCDSSDDEIVFILIITFHHYRITRLTKSLRHICLITIFASIVTN